MAKIVGDATHVLFGALGEQPDHAPRAVSCALDAAAEIIRARGQAQGVTLGPTRIGVQLRPSIVGSCGAWLFFEYTAYSDTINTAARLEGGNKALGTRIWISAAAERVEGFRGRPVGDLVLRGKSESMRALAPHTEAMAAEPATARSVAAFAKHAAGEVGAVPAFAALVGMNPRDHLASFHLRRLLNGGSGTRIDLRTT